MATRPMKTITGLPGLEGNTYTFVQIDNQLATAGKAADAKAVGDALAEINETLPTKANVDGSYESMTVGNAEQLVATVGVQDKVPYIFRTSGGSNDIGDREVDKIVGGTVAWNQLVQNGNFENAQYWYGVQSVANNIASFTPTAKYGNINQQLSGKPLVANHKYLLCVDVKAASERNNIGIGIGDNVTFTDSKTIHVTTNWQRFGKMYVETTVSYAATHPVFVRDDADSGFVEINVRNFVLFDLTQMFGSTIADYIYSLEQATAGAGVAWFRKLFPKPYYAYNAGALMHVQTSGHKMVGFNQFNLSEFARLYPDKCQMDGDELYFTTLNGELATTGVPVNIPADAANGAYFMAEVKAGTAVNPRLKVFYEDGTSTNLAITTSTTYQKYTTLLSPKRIVKVTIDYSTNGTAYFKNACINLIWSGYRNGEYEPYTERTYPLDSDLVLRGKPKKDANGNLYYDGDEYVSDGTVNRKRKEIDLGEQDWTYNSTYQFFITSLEDAKSPANADALPDLVCTKYEEKTPRFVIDTSYGNGIALAISGYGGEGKLVVRDTAYTDAATFTSAMSGVMLDYPLATPTTESADPFQNPQWVDDFGTEEYIDTRDVPIPVGHDTFYRANLRDKLQHLPEPAESNGMYAIQQTDEQMALVPMPAVLPALPTEDGTYSLKITVSGSTKTLTWEADE